MRSETASILLKIHEILTGNCQIDFTGRDFIQKYQIEYAILENMHQPTISNGPRRCSGCHDESGIAITISNRIDQRYDFLYTSPSGDTHSDYSLTIFNYTPKSSHVCTEMYHRKPGQEPNSGWVKHADGNTAVNELLSMLDPLAS